MHRWVRAFTAAAASVILSTVPAHAQGLLLQLKPRVGDTLYMRLDQTSRLTGSRSGTTQRETQEMVINEMHAFSHALVESRSAEGTTLLAITDSVVLTSTDPRTRAVNVQTAQILRGQRTRIRIALDGAVTVLAQGNSATAAPRGMAEALSLMPATFPRAAVAVDETWVREMLVPAGTSAFGTTVGGRVRAIFRLDSTSRGGQIAHVSLRGELQPAAAGARGAAMLQSGSMSGTLVVDRGRGWLVESDVTVIAQSVMLPLAGLAGTGMRLEMTVTQRMRLVDPPRPPVR